MTDFKLDKEQMHTLYEIKMREFRARKEMPSYIKRLESLMKISKDELQFVNPEQVAALPDNVKKIRIEFPFEEKYKVEEIFQQIGKYKDGPLYLFTEGSIDCGMLLLKNLGEFNPRMDVNPLEVDIVSLTLADSSNEIVINIDELNDSYYFDILLKGDDWTRI